MPDGSAITQQSPNFSILLVGPFSSGKTRNSLTFPKCYVISFDSPGLDIVHEPENKEIAKNLVWYETIKNESEEELKKVFLESSKENTSIFGCLSHARELAKEGKIKTLILDGFTYLVDMRWQYINEFEETRSANTGNLDLQAMYKNLGLWLQRFVPSEVLTFTTRYNCHVIVTVHLKREARDIVEGSDKFKTRARRVSTESDIAPMIEGSYRNKIEGIFGAHIYLENRLQADGKTQYMAYCEKTIAFGTVVLAGNNYGLSPKLDITNKSFYDVLTSNINKGQSVPDVLTSNIA